MGSRKTYQRGEVMTWNKNMDDAPRDGTWILVSGVSVFINQPQYVSEAYGAADGFYTDQGLLVNQPNHWMYKPHPPEVEG